MNWIQFLGLNKILVDDIDVLIDNKNIEYQIKKIDRELMVIKKIGNYYDKSFTDVLHVDDCDIRDNKIICDDWEGPNTYTIKLTK